MTDTVGMRAMSVFDPEVFKPGSAVWYTNGYGTCACLVKKCSYTIMDVAFVNIASGKVTSSRITLEDLAKGQTVVPIENKEVL